MTIVFLTNPIAGGWQPDDLAVFLGGNEESLVLLSRALARAGHTVRVHTSLSRMPYTDAAGVTWDILETFSAAQWADVFVSWKNRDVWRGVPNARLKIHASQDVEPPLPATFDLVSTLGSHHAARMAWVPPAARRHMPLGIDRTVYCCTDEAPDPLALYATSPDRGLERLLIDWRAIRAMHPGLSLLITYDWTRLSTMSGPQGAAYAAHLERLANQPGVSRGCVDQATMVATFQRARFYIHPLPRPDADLFGFGALKAALCGATLVLPPVAGTGFADTVRNYIPYADFVAGATDPLMNPGWCQPPLSWDEVVTQYWLPVLASAT
jgi:hypothetical protein